MSRGRARARSPEDQEKVRQRFIDCARTVFAEEGARGLTMRRLASEAGYSPGTIYLYFPSRQDLLREIWKSDIQSLWSDLTEATRGREGLHRLDALLRGYADFWLARPDHFMAMFMEVDRQFISERAVFATDESVQAIHAMLLDETTAALQEAGQAAKVSEDKLTTLAQSLLAAVHGVVSLQVSNPAYLKADSTNMVNTVVIMLLTGLKATIASG
jgi:AcrR family transcriptional regulator